MENILITGVELCSKQIKILKLQLREYLANKIKTQETEENRFDRRSRKRRSEYLEIIDDSDSDEEPVTHKRRRVSENVVSTNNRENGLNKRNKRLLHSDSSSNDDDGYYDVTTSQSITPFNGRNEKRSKASIWTTKSFRNNEAPRRMNIVDSSDSENDKVDWRTLKEEDCLTSENLTKSGGYNRKLHIGSQSLATMCSRKYKGQTSKANAQSMYSNEQNSNDDRNMSKKVNNASTDSSNKKNNIATITNKEAQLLKKSYRKRLLKETVIDEREHSINVPYKRVLLGTEISVQVNQRSKKSSIDPIEFINEDKGEVGIKNKGGRPRKVREVFNNLDKDLSKKDLKVVLKRSTRVSPQNLKDDVAGFEVSSLSSLDEIESCTALQRLPKLNNADKRVKVRSKKLSDGSAIVDQVDVGAIVGRKQKKTPVRQAKSVTKTADIAESASDKRGGNVNEEEDGVDVGKTPTVKRGWGGNRRTGTKKIKEKAVPKYGRGRYPRKPRKAKGVKVTSVGKRGRGRWPASATVTEATVCTNGASLAQLMAPSSVDVSKATEVHESPIDRSWRQAIDGFTTEAGAMKLEMEYHVTEESGH